MLQQYSRQIRRTAIVAATALAVSLPGAASAGVFKKAAQSTAAVAKKTAKKTVNKTKRKAATAVTIVRKGGGAVQNLGRNLAENLPGDLSAAELFDLVQELQIMEQLRDTMGLLREIQGDYRNFSGGVTGCKGECKAFRTELKGLFGDLLSLTDEVPVLQKRANLIANIERMSDLIDYVPPRALYLMWQGTGDQIDELRFAAENIRQALIALPPLVEMSDIIAAVNGGISAVNDTNSAICGWVNRDDKPVIEWLQAELEMQAWGYKTLEGYVPDLDVKLAIGASAGAAVANGEAEGGLAVKPTDVLKIALNVSATVFEAIDQVIKVNTARAKLVCAATAYVSN